MTTHLDILFNLQIKAFAKSKGAEFPMMNKIDVNGPKGNKLTFCFNYICKNLT